MSEEDKKGQFSAKKAEREKQKKLGNTTSSRMETPDFKKASDFSGKIRDRKDYKNKSR